MRLVCGDDVLGAAHRHHPVAIQPQRLVAGRADGLVGVQSGCTVPCVGGQMPAITRSSVDLPAPLAPIRPSRSSASREAHVVQCAHDDDAGVVLGDAVAAPRAQHALFQRLPGDVEDRQVQADMAIGCCDRKSARSLS